MDKLLNWGKRQFYQIKKRILRLRLYQFLMITFHSIFSLAILIMVLISVIITGRITINNYVSYASQFLQDMQRNIESIMTNVEAYSRFILSEESIQLMLQTDSGDPAYNIRVRDAREEVTRLLLEQEYIESLSVYSMDGSGFTAGDGPSYSIDFSTWKSQDWYQDALDRKGNYLWGNAVFDGIRGRENRVIFCRVINKSDTMDGIGIMVCIMNSDYFFNMVEDVSETNIGNFYIYGEQGELFFGNLQTDENMHRQMERALAEMENTISSGRYGTYLITGYNEEHLGWKIICVGRLGTVLENQWAIFTVIILVFLLVIVLASYVYGRFAHGITRELQNLNEMMGRAEHQDFKEEIRIERIWEFVQLGEAYNRLMNRIDTLLNEVMQQKLNAKQAQLESLQAQINPHFLYNTLDCINWKAMTNHQMEISEMIQSLSMMFRFSLGNGEKEIELSKEIENVRNYLFLQKMRYEDNLVYLIDIPENVQKYRVMKFFLQPLVENSILHGLQPLTKKGYIGIAAEETDGVLIIQEWDNGIGIDEEQIARLLEGYTYDDNKKRQKHGIYNVNERLRLRYGEESALHFENRKKGGTKVTIRIRTEKLKLSV